MKTLKQLTTVGRNSLTASKLHEVLSCFSKRLNLRKITHISKPMKQNSSREANIPSGSKANFPPFAELKGSLACL
jgi:hypothetical protein